MKKIPLTLAFTLAGLALFAAPALADIAQTDTSTIQALSTFQTYQALGNGLSGSLDQIDYQVPLDENHFMALGLYYSSAADFTGLTQISTTGDDAANVYACTTQRRDYDGVSWLTSNTSADTYCYNNASTTMTWYFNPISVSSGLYYYIGFRNYGYAQISGSAITGVPATHFYTPDIKTIDNVAFRAYGVVGGYDFTGIPPISINFLTPTDGATTLDFGDWLATGSGYAGTLQINYNNFALSSTTYLDYLYLHGAMSTSTTYDIPKSTLLWYVGVSSTPEWTATIFDNDDRPGHEGDVLASSTINFYINGTSTAPIIGPSPPPAESCDFADFPCRIKGWFISLIWPTSTSFTQFDNLGNVSLGSKIPLGYIPLLVSTFGGLNASGTPIATTTDLAGLSDVISPVDELIATLLFLLGGYWLIHRISRTEI